MKKLVPVRLLKNKFYDQVTALEEQCAPEEALRTLLGKGRARAGMLEGDLDEGELEIGQVSGSINRVLTCREVVESMMAEYRQSIARLPSL